MLICQISASLTPFTCTKSNSIYALKLINSIRKNDKISKKKESLLNNKYMYFEVIRRMEYSILAFSDLKAVTKQIKEILWV